MAIGILAEGSHTSRLRADPSAGWVREKALRRLQTGEIPTAQNNWRGNNRARYSSPEYDVLVDSYVATLNAQERLDFANTSGT